VFQLLLVAPGQVYAKSRIEATNALQQATLYSNKWDRFQNREEEVLKKKEAEERRVLKKRQVDAEEARRKNSQTIVDMATNKDPALVALKAIATEPVIAPELIITGIPFDLKASEGVFTDRMTQLNAQAKLAKIEADKANVVAEAAANLSEAEATEKRINILTNCSPAFNYLITNLWSIVAELANTNGDKVVSNYKGDLTQPSFYFVKMQTNQWFFRMNVSVSDKPTLTVRCNPRSDMRNQHIDPGLVATIMFNPLSKDLYSKLTHSAPMGGSETNILTEKCPIEDYKKTLDSLLIYIIGAQSKLHPLTNLHFNN
jgi:hypothetical protein